jgi:Carboxypeptidase regulatory-like domain
MKTLARHLTLIFDRRTIPLVAVAVVLAMLTNCRITFAQSGAGSIQGTVTDPSGAIIPGAAIHVVNQATGVADDTKSNNVGFYQVPGLLTGTYTVVITAPGMKRVEQSIELLVAQDAVINPVMTAGAVTQQVEVSSNIVQLTTTDTAAIGATLENSRINQLPMNGRFLITLGAATTPGMEGKGVGVGQRANGLFEQGTDFVADGVSLGDRYIGSLTNASLPDPDAVQEVQVLMNNNSAQYESPTTEIITTKSGTNILHGTFFETARNNAWGIAKGRSDPYNLVVPHLVRNEFGASAGGPIILPKIYHGKDKSFWFVAYERYSLAQSANAIATVPTLAMRKGDFSGLINSSGVLQQAYDPLTTAPSSNCNGTGTANPYCRAPFLNNQIPIGRIAPAAKILEDITPLPTNSANPLIQPNFTGPNPTYSTIPTLTFRLDQAFNERNRAYLRFTMNSLVSNTNRNFPIVEPVTIAADGFPYGASTLAQSPSDTVAPAIEYTHVFSPTFYAETIVSQQWFEYRAFSASNGADYEQKLGLPNNFGELGFPGIGVSGSTVETIYPFEPSQFIYDSSQIVSTIDENLTKIVGRHQMQFGGRYRHERLGELPDESADTETLGAYATALENPSSGSNYTAANNTGFADTDLFLGAASSYSASLSPPYHHLHDMDFAAYFQDNYHATRYLTVNLGLRWTGYPAPWVKYGLKKSFDLVNDAMVLSVPASTLIAEGYTTQAIITNLLNIGAKIETPAQAGYSPAMQKNHYYDFGPRFGFAYQPFNGKHGTVIRGGWGRYYFVEPQRQTFNNTAIGVPESAGYTQSYIAANQSPDGLANYLLRAPQAVVMGQNSASVVNSSATNSLLPGGVGVNNLDPNSATSYANQVSFTIEQPMKGNSVLRASWVLVQGKNLITQYDYNFHPSTFTWEVATGTALPTGGASVIGTPQQNTYAATGTGPYDKTTWGGTDEWQAKDGWSNDNELEVNYQRLFHSGVAYQFLYLWSKPMRVGGASGSVGSGTTGPIYPTGSFGLSGSGSWASPYGTVGPLALPPPRPAGIAPYADYKALRRYEWYMIDTTLPQQHIQFNWVYDLPFGAGKRFLPNANRFLDEVVGGWQIAGIGNIVSQSFQPLLTNFGPTNPLHVYKHGAPITDCRSGVCYKSYEWFNGYLAPATISGNSCSNSAGAKVVSGLPSNYAPYQSPIDTDCNSADAAYKYYNTDDVNVTLSNGTVLQGVPFSPGTRGFNPYTLKAINGPNNYTVSLSAFKVFPITERIGLRINVDAFNALNVQGYNNPNTTDGTEAVQPNGVSSSFNTPRQLQFTARLTF